MKKALQSIIKLGVVLLFVSCDHGDFVYSPHSDWSVTEKQDTVGCILPDLSSSRNEESELQRLNSELMALNTKFGVAITRSGDWSWPKFWTITGSDAVGAVVGGLIWGWWGALGVGVSSSIGSYKSGKSLDDYYQSWQPPTSPSTNSNTDHFFVTSSFVGYDENGIELSYDLSSLYEDEEYICIDDEIRDQLGSLHNRVVIALCQQYGDSLALMSNYTIIDRSLELVASWYGIDYSEIPYFDPEETILETCVLEDETDLESLMLDYPEYAGYFPIIENYIVAISQLHDPEDILSYQTQAICLLQNSNLSSFAQASLQSGLDVLICSNGLWIIDDEWEEAPDEDETEEE